MAVQMTTAHEQALIDAINDAENHADSLVDGEELLEQADRLSEVLVLVRELLKENN